MDCAPFRSTLVHIHGLVGFVLIKVDHVFCIVVCRVASLLAASRLCQCNRGRRGRDRMVVGFLTTCTINAYHH
jgi:hypothetical protein